MPEKTSPLTPEFTYDERSRRYRNKSTGRFTSQKIIRTATEDVVNAARADMIGASRALIEQRITAAEWQLAMEESIRLTHTGSAAIARGGWAQMSQADWGWVGSKIRKQYDFFDGFIADIESGKQKLNGTLVVRADLYANAGRGTSEGMRARIHNAQGFDEVGRELGAADHCSDCIDWSIDTLGYHPIEELGSTVHLIGESICLTRCHCTYVFRRSATGETSQ